MSTEKEALFMREIIGTTKKEIASYFGTPMLDYPEIAIFRSKEKGGYIVVTFSAGEANEYVLYSLEKKFLCSTMDTIYLTEDEIEAWKNKGYIEFEKQYGQLHADLGSGCFIPGYIGRDAYIYVIDISGGKIKDILKIGF